MNLNMQISSKTSQNVAYRVKCWLLQGSITCNRLKNEFWSNCLLLIGRFQLTANKSLGFVCQLRDHSAAQPSVASPCCGMVNMPRWLPRLYSSFACQHSLGLYPEWPRPTFHQQPPFPCWDRNMLMGSWDVLAA